MFADGDGIAVAFFIATFAYVVADGGGRSWAFGRARLFDAFALLSVAFGVVGALFGFAPIEATVFFGADLVAFCGAFPSVSATFVGAFVVVVFDSSVVFARNRDRSVVARCHRECRERCQ